MQSNSECWENKGVGTCPSPCQVSHLEKFHMSFAIFIEQMMCQEGFTCIQGDCKDLVLGVQET